jgi:hypothetical protein
MRRASALGLLASLAACGAASGDVRGSGIDGKIVAGPTCPVERVPPDPRCAPRPLAASLRIHPAGKRSPVETAHSGQNGRFRVALPAGAYVVRPLARPGSPFPRPPSPIEVRVSSGRFTHVTITYDTGIR